MASAASTIALAQWRLGFSQLLIRRHLRMLVLDLRHLQPDPVPHWRFPSQWQPAAGAGEDYGHLAHRRIAIAGSVLI
jgi:hypothetical protein